jgi:hypothetical protein
MRGIDQYNFPAFHAAAHDLSERGHSVLSPAEHDEDSGFDPTGSLESLDLAKAMRWDIESVLDCDAVVVLPNWYSSVGANLEVTVARAIGTPVLDYPSLEPAKEESISLEAHRLVRGARQNAYGHPHSDFSRTGRIWGAILGIPDIDPALIGLCMAAVKISREVNAPKRDNLVDLAGYAETIQLVREKESE